MSRELLLNIANKQLVEAKSILEKELLRIMEAKLLEKKKMIAASTFSESANVEEAKSPKDAIKDAENKASALGTDFAKKTKDGKLPNPPSSVFDKGSRWSVSVIKRKKLMKA